MSETIVHGAKKISISVSNEDNELGKYSITRIKVIQEDGITEEFTIFGSKQEPTVIEIVNKGE